jgi:hypothetical protein
MRLLPNTTKEEDPDFSPEDIRYSVIRYVATTRNAVGPSVTDPRTGEIIESDVIWYHNHLRSYRNRYLETGLQILQHEPYTPVMRKWEYDAHGYSS